MTTGPVRASSEWLRLREPADAAARASELVEKARSYLPTHGGATIHDLGCGTGSMARWLAVRLPGPQHWVMYDRDDDLLTLAAANPPDRAADGTQVTMETRRRDITQMEPVELAGGALITASALLDMMTAEELQRLVATCAGVDCPVLIALSVTGRVEITPRSPGPAQSVAARPRSRRSRGRLVHRLAGRSLRAATRAAGACSLVRQATFNRGIRRPPLCHGAPPGFVGGAEMTARKSTRSPCPTPRRRGPAAGPPDAQTPPPSVEHWCHSHSLHDRGRTHVLGEHETGSLQTSRIMTAGRIDDRSSAQCYSTGSTT
jgi:hypothetical protein